MARIAAVTLLAALSSAITACAPSIGKEIASAPGVAVPDDWLVEPEAVEPAAADYWTLLDDPLVTQLTRQVIAENRDLAVAVARVAQARAGVRQARAGYLPRVDASAGLQRDVGDLASDDLQVSFGGDVQWEIDLFGRIRYDVAASRAELDAANYALADVQRLIVGQVVQTAIAARALAVQLAIARETLAIQDDNLQIAQWRRQAGLVSSLDVEQARAQRAQTAATIPALESDLAASAHAISTLIGEPPGRVLELLTAQARTIPAPPATIGFAAPAEVLRRRPDVRQAEAVLLADSARIGVARAQLLPLVQLTGTIGTASSGFDGLFHLITGGLFAGVSQLLFDGGRTRAQIAAAQAAAAASLAVWERTILVALEEVESAAADLRAARARVILFAEARDAAESAAILARSQYEAGLIDFQTLLTAENQLLAARNALAASEAERAGAFVQLTQALGGGWDIDTAIPAEEIMP